SMGYTSRLLPIRVCERPPRRTARLREPRDGNRGGSISTLALHTPRRAHQLGSGRWQRRALPSEWLCPLSRFHACDTSTVSRGHLRLPFLRGLEPSLALTEGARG